MHAFPTLGFEPASKLISLLEATAHGSTLLATKLLTLGSNLAIFEWIETTPGENGFLKNFVA